MRFKVGNQWFECGNDTPIMVELTNGDQRNIANMHPSATRYAIFDAADPMTVEERERWMKEGATPVE